jgi:hypothetical protein
VIDLHVEILGVTETVAMLGNVGNLPMEKIHRAMGNEAVDRIRDRTLDGKTLDGQAMPQSLRAMGDDGITLYDTRLMLGHSMGVKGADAAKTTVGFDADRALIARWNHAGAKTRNGKWRPRPRPFFGFGAGDKEAIAEAGQEMLDAHVKKVSGQ